MTKFETLEAMAFEALEDKGFNANEKEAARQLLTQELDCVSATGSAEMFLAAADLCREARTGGILLDPSPCGVGSMSMLSYLLEIGIDNPLRYPEYDSLPYFKRKLGDSHIITFFCREDGHKLMLSHLRNRYPKGKLKENYESFKFTVPETDEYSLFHIHGAMDYESSRREKTIGHIYNSMCQHIDVNDIPQDDGAAFEVFNSLAWNGVTVSVVFTSVMDAVKNNPAASILQIWRALNTYVYVAGGIREDGINHVCYPEAVRVYHMAYLKAHYREAFDAMLMDENAK